MVDKSYVLLCIVTICGGLCTAEKQKPNIILIVADDLGWNDVGFHGSNQIPTPNIDALAFSGLILQDYYVAPICTPSRAALMTGKYPIHTGMQNGVIYGMERKALPLSEKLLPQYLKDLGYSTHLVGKWHLGHYKREYLPLNRGFDSHVGFWTGRIDMYDHTSVENGTWGFDFRRGFDVAHDLFGKYVTDVYTDEAIKVIKAHDKTKPLFLMVSHSAVHSGNPYEPIRAPDSVIANFTSISDLQRRKFAAVVTKLDESIGKVVTELGTQGLLENSIILFTTDNGGPAAGFNDNAASNYPLRGVKNTLWEGGIRAAGFLWSPLIEENSRIAKQMLHITDWLPTFYGAAGGNNSELHKMDGFDQWPALSLDLPSLRNTIVHNIDDTYDSIYGSASMTIGQWKVHVGTNYKGAWDKWYGPDGRYGVYDLEAVHRSYTAKVLKQLERMPDNAQMSKLRSEATLECSRGIAPIECKPLQAPCLFNIKDDPCELRNMADEQPELLQRALNHLKEANRTAVKPVDKKLDLCGDPKYWGHVFTNFGDYEGSQCEQNLLL